MFVALHWGLIGQAWIAEKRGNHALAVQLWQTLIDRFPNASHQKWQARAERSQRLLSSRPVTLDLASSATAQAYLAQVNNNDAALAKGKNLRFSSVLIVTYGRSGSTLLQGLLNTIDGVLIRGENNNAFRHLFEAYTATCQQPSHASTSNVPNVPWFGINKIDPNAMLDSFRKQARIIVLSDRQNDPKVTCFGFKEIRYPELGAQLDSYLDFLGQIFQDTAFVFLTRDHDQVVKSGWWQDQDPSQVRTELQAFERRTRSFSKGRQNCFHLDYADMVNKTAHLRAMYAFLGADFDEQVVDLVLATPHSYRPSETKNKKIFQSFSEDGAAPRE